MAAAAIALVASPPLIAFLLVGARELSRRSRPASWKWSALLLVCIASSALVQRFFDMRAFLGALTEPTPLGMLAPMIAGLLWGAYVLTMSGWVFAPIHGLGKIRHDALWPVLRAWLALASLRAAALFVLHSPIVYATWRASGELGLPARVALAFGVPVSGLLAHFWLLSLVDNLSVYLDVELVSGAATSRNPWHATIKRYFRGYLRRSSVEIDEALVARTLFLPSAIDHVTSYGGGFARPRILVGERPREAALGELPDEAELPDRTVNPEELPVGILVPSMREREDLGQLVRADHRRRGLTLAPPRPRAPMPRLIGENATLLGRVIPSSADEGLPLISDTEEDFGVVKKLLTEHYAGFEQGIDGDEVDDTDPRQKDFLFGALLREIGVVLRQDTLLSTIRSSLEVASSRAKSLDRFFVRPPIVLYERFLSGPAAKVGDAYAALHAGFHHLIQYLCFVRGTDEALLTARADEPRLVKASHEMLARIANEANEPNAANAANVAGDLDLFRATPRSRVAWLARFFHAPLARPTVRWGRVLGALAFAALAGVFVVRSVRDAIAYHPTYVARMKAQAVRPSEGDSAR